MSSVELLKDPPKQEHCCHSLTLHHDNPEDFYESLVFKSEFGMRMYRFIALFLVLVIDVMLVVGGLEIWGVKVFGQYAKFLTHWSFFVLTCDCLLSFMVVEMPKMDLEPESGDLPWLLKLHWFVYYISANASMITAIGFWVAVYPFLDAYYKGWAWASLPGHGFNFLYHVVNACLTKTPVKFVHVYLIMIYCSIYSIFSGVYFVTGGTAWGGHHYLYRIIDYEQHPILSGIAAGILAIFSPLASHAFFWSLCKTRNNWKYR